VLGHSGSNRVPGRNRLRFFWNTERIGPSPSEPDLCRCVPSPDFRHHYRESPALKDTLRANGMGELAGSAHTPCPWVARAPLSHPDTTTVVHDRRWCKAPLPLARFGTVALWKGPHFVAFASLPFPLHHCGSLSDNECGGPVKYVAKKLRTILLK
jgi:hypothetical protein